MTRWHIPILAWGASTAAPAVALAADTTAKWLSAPDAKEAAGGVAGLLPSFSVQVPDGAMMAAAYGLLAFAALLLVAARIARLVRARGGARPGAAPAGTGGHDDPYARLAEEARRR